MAKKYALVHKDNGEILRLSDTPPVIDGDVVRFLDGEMRGVKWGKVQIVEIECEKDLPKSTQSIEEHEDKIEQRAYLNMTDSIISINDKIESVVIKPLDNVSFNKKPNNKEIEVIRSFLEKVLQKDYPKLWDEYCIAIDKINNTKE